jgi:hypothetical protein
MNRWALGVGGLLLLCGGCSLTTSFVVQDRLSRVPRMTCAQLARNGPPADGQVILTDLKACGRTVGGESDGDLDLYVPAYPAGLGREPAPPDLAFLVQMWDDDAWRRLRDGPGPVEVVCWVHRGARVVECCRGPGEVEIWARDGLQTEYPGLRMADAWVLTVGHGSTPTPERVQSAWNYGIGELLFGTAVLVCGAVAAWRRRRLAPPAPPPGAVPTRPEEGAARPVG